MNVSDVIENFINEMMGESATLNINRNELAAYFACAPSQINYVLSTRFTVDRGYTVNSRRGGGGSITVARLKTDRGRIMRYIDGAAETGLSCARAGQICDMLTENGIISEREAAIIRAAVSDKAIVMPFGSKDITRAHILRNIILTLTEEEA